MQNEYNMRRNDAYTKKSGTNYTFGHIYYNDIQSYSFIIYINIYRIYTYLHLYTSYINYHLYGMI